MLRSANKISSFATASRLFASSGVARKFSIKSAWSKIWRDGGAWNCPENERVMATAYGRHQSLGDRADLDPPKPTLAELESLGTVLHYPAKTFGDKCALALVSMLKPFTHAFFKERYGHHAVVLETVAAVPGFVAGMFRHLRSLRRMQRDHGWIHPLLEEAENERMHLLIWMQVTQPTRLERVLVAAAQGFYFTVYAGLYLFTPRVAHRFVGYLEEEAVAAYTLYLQAVDAGKIPNGPAPEIARTYYKLPEDATIRDVILYVRADECMHRNFNHRLSELAQDGKLDQHPQYPPQYPAETATEKQVEEK